MSFAPVPSQSPAVSPTAPAVVPWPLPDEVSAAPCRRPEFLLFSPPSIGEEGIGEITAALRSGWITTGPRTRRFEQEFAELLGSPGTLALNSCTAGLHVALASLGLGAG